MSYGETPMSPETAVVTPTEATITLDLSEYEASVVTGALIEFAAKWGTPDGDAAAYLRDRVRDQLPAEWKS
jgi:hypothetical protein